MLGARLARVISAVVASLAVLVAVVFGAGPAMASGPQGTLTLAQSLTGTGASGSTATVPSGAGLSVVLNYTCAGFDCLNSVITVPIPTGMTTGNPSISGDVASVATSGTTVTYTMNATLAAGSTGQLVVPVGIPAWTTLDNTAFSWQSTMTAPSATTATTAAATITAHAGNTTATTVDLSSGGAVGQGAKYTVTVCPNASATTGYGPLGIAANSTVTATLPVGAVYITSSGTAPYAGAYASGPRTVTWTMPALNGCGSIWYKVNYPSSDSSNVVGASKTAPASWTGHSLGAPTDVPLGTGQKVHALVAAQPAMSFNKTSYTGNMPTTQSLTYFLTANNTGNTVVDSLDITDDIPGDIRVTNSNGDNPSATAGTLWVSSRLGPDGIANTSDDGQLVQAATLAANAHWDFNPYATWASGAAALPTNDVVKQIVIHEFDVPTSSAAGASVTATLPTTRFNGSTVNVGDQFTNTATYAWSAGGSPMPTETKSWTVTVAPQIPTLVTRTGGGGTLGIGVTQTPFTVSAAAGGFDAPNPILMMVLPPTVSMVSWSGAAYGSSLPTPSLTQVANFNGVTGSTLLRWTWPSGTVMPVGTSYEVTVNGQLSSNAWGANTIEGYSSLRNATTYCDSNYFGSGVDTLDRDGDGDTTETLCKWNTSVTPAATTTAALTTTANGNYTTGYVPATAYTTPGSSDAYRVTLTNTGTIQQTNAIIVDVLPRPGDTKILSSVPRNMGTGTFPVLLRGTPVVPSLSSAVRTYYSTVADPCRPEVSSSPTGCAAPAWSTTAPSNLATVTAVKIDFGSNVIDPFTSWTVQLPVTTPTSGATEPDYADWNADPSNPSADEIAANSAAFISTSVASSANLAPTESNVVALRIPSHAGVSGVAPTPSALTATGVGTAPQAFSPVVPTNGTVTLLDGSTPVTTLTVAGKGVYTVDAGTGVITFVPVLGYVGTPPLVTYRVTNMFGDHADQTVAAHVTMPPAPTAGPVTTTGVGGAPQTHTITLPTGSHAYLIDGQGNQVTSLTRVGQGTYEMDGTTGVLTFTPILGYAGTATAAPYRLLDAYGQNSDSTATATVTAPPAPTAAALTTTGIGTTPQQLLVTIPAGGQVRLVNNSGAPATSVTVVGEGTYALDTASGRITFTPVLGFDGVGTGVSYRITDAYNHSDTSTVTPTVTPPPGPVATALTSTGPGRQTSQVAAPSGTTVRLLDGQGTPATSVTVSNEGTYTLDPATNTITFEPASGFAGVGTGVGFRLTDPYGTRADSTYVPTVTATAPVTPPATTTTPPSATPPAAPPAPPIASKATTGTGTDQQQIVVTVPSGGSIDLVTGDGDTVRKIEVPDTGTWALNRDTGKIRFIPALGFVGTASVRFQVKSADGATSFAVYSVVVSAPAGPVARALTSHRVGSTPQQVGVNLPAGGGARLLTAKGRPTTKVVMPGQGTYRMNERTGLITFTPVRGFVGTPDQVRYQLFDAYGQKSSSVYQPAGYPATGNQLASTGLNVVPMGGVALLLAGAGAALLLLRRRRNARAV